MKSFYILLVLILSFTAVAQTSSSPFAGTWKWEDGNQRFYVYITAKTLDSGNKVLRVDYKMVMVANAIETEIYNSKIDGTYLGAGAIMVEYESYASGSIKDCTHPYTTDCYDGLISLKPVPPTGIQPVGTPPKLRWKLYKHGDPRQLVYTSNPPTGFNLPLEILLTKVQGLRD